MSSVTNGRCSFSLYRTVFAKEFGNIKDLPLEEQLRTILSEGHRVVTETFEGETIVAAVTGLMERAHALPEAGRVVFVDASGNMDRRGLRVFLLMTWSHAGGLPLGVVVTSSEAETTVAKGLAMLKGIFPEGMYSTEQSASCIQSRLGFLHLASRGSLTLLQSDTQHTSTSDTQHTFERYAASWQC